MPNLTDTMTFVFTDIVSSTRMWEDQLSMGPALRTHDEIVRAALVGEGGHVFSMTGDGFGAAFEQPDAAIRAAVAVQRRLGDTVWPNGAQIAVRIGMHLGPAEARDGNYFGPPVNRSARVMAIAQARQIVVTAMVRDSVAGSLPDDIALVPLGPVELKDITEPIEVYSVSTRGVDVRPVPARAPSLAAGNLPERVAALVGRDRATSDVVEALDRHRLVTLVGVGGVGKTTLATDVGRNVRQFTDGVWIVKLGQIQDGRAVVPAIADALRVSATGVTIDELVDNTLRTRRMLLLLDNCEHVVGAVTDAVAALLDRTPHVRVLATSREPLHLAGERVVTLSPLSVRPPGTGPSEAADLFLRRAAESGVELDVATHGAAIDELCRRLDGLPLAIELAAAKTRAFDPSRLVDLLGHRLDLLGSVARSTDTRHHTLRATFDWSYELLDERDRMLFDRLGVMAGPFDLDDLVAIGADVLTELEVVNSLASLVDKSLVQRVASSPPFRLLESLREFSMEQLVAVGADQDVSQALIVLAHLARNPDECSELALRATEAAVERHQPHWELDALTYQGFGKVMEGDTAAALAIARELRGRGDAIADRSRIGWSHYVVARALSSTDPAAALVALDEARAIADEVANPNLELSSRRHRASALIIGEDPEAAEDAIRSLLDRTLELGEIDHARRTCALAGVTRAMRRDDETAALLIGRLGLPNRTPADLVHFQRIAEELAERLGDRHQSLLARGRSMSVGETIDLTIASLN